MSFFFLTAYKCDYMCYYICPGSLNQSVHLPLTSLISKEFPPTELSLNKCFLFIIFFTQVTPGCEHSLSVKAFITFQVTQI